MHILRLTVSIFVYLVPFCVCGQINNQLKAELDSIYHVDQLYRDILDNPPKKDSLAKVHNLSGQEVDQRIFDKMTEIDHSNIKRVKKIIEQYGYPGTKLVGSPTNEAAWYVIQHSEDISEYFPLIEKAGKSKELPFDLVAMMQDRLLMGQGKEQLYGTQVRCENSECYVWPIANPTQVNQRRKQAGFKTTVEQNAKRLGVAYKIRTLPKK
ncbi:DUF6624 domain-containing protein [Dyadobacter arcticus]|uniref:Uncharacterized protein n=1 Tax=Dyadobacter arcticus TaxID=1078754 RepID=A0ABX0USE2_9BACT|nr:DUF6624 domain-containing protein [Dyadobacter arcticus]NIJ54565.1 hypothetical protein [Dyadobacter arcticus]